MVLRSSCARSLLNCSVISLGSLALLVTAYHVACAHPRPIVADLFHDHPSPLQIGFCSAVRSTTANRGDWPLLRRLSLALAAACHSISGSSPTVSELAGHALAQSSMFALNPGLGVADDTRHSFEARYRLAVELEI